MDVNGLLVSNELHEHTITLPDGTPASVYVRELPQAEFRRYYLAEHSEDEETRVGSVARLLSAGVCKPDGSPLLTYKQALQLKPTVAAQLFEALLITNGKGTKGNA